MGNWTEEQLAERNARVFDGASMIGAFAPKAEAAPKKRRKITSEAEIARVCTQVLIHDGWRYLKTDPVSRRAHGKGFGEVGMADALFIRYDGFGWSGTLEEGQEAETKALSQVIWLEWKREDGKPAEHQTRWHRDERAKGALTLIAGVDFEASVSGFMDWYGKSGLRRTAMNG